MLRVWFSCPFVPSEHGVKMFAPLEVCTKDKQHETERFCYRQEWKRQRSIDSWLPSLDRTVCHNEVFTNRSKCLQAAEPVLLKQTGKDAHPHPQTNKTWSVIKQWFLETVGWLLRKQLQDWTLMLLVLGANLYCRDHLYTTLTRHKRTTTEPHSQHVSVWPWATVWPGLSSVTNHTTKYSNIARTLRVPLVQLRPDLWH
jgi:hypothetical protein